MPDTGSKIDLKTFEDFLAYLRTKGFPVGVEEHVRVRLLFDKLGSDFLENDSAPDTLRRLLCPLFAVNKAQQDKFYKEFDTYIDYLQARSGSGEGGGSGSQLPKPNPVKTIILIVAVIVAIAGAIFLTVYFSGQRQNTGNSNGISNQASNVNQSNFPSNSSSNINEAVSGEVQKKENDTRPQNSAIIGSNNTPPPSPFNANISPIATPAPTPPERQIWSVFKPWFYYAIALLLPLLIFLLYEWFSSRQQKRMLSRQHEKRPPYNWILHPKIKAPAIYNSPEFYGALRLMRKRQVDEFHRLNIPATIAATIRACGFPSFRYTQANKVPEYLVLINRISPGDHQARLFGELVRTFQKESVFVVHYFYEDLRICVDETERDRFRLIELQIKYPNHRLIIFGDGNEMIDPITGEFEEWAAIFQNWNERALLTPDRPSVWGLREITLAKNFLVLPGTVYGLSKLVDQIETTVPRPLGSWRGDKAALDSRRIDGRLDAVDPAGVVEKLRAYLGEDVFEWLCACAVYPVLDWELTLFLGGLPGFRGKLVNEENLLKLVNLEWFRRGNIPDDVRWHLISLLIPAREKEVRAALIKLLEESAPKGAQRQTYAADDRELNLLAQRWLLEPSRKHLRELLKKVKQLPMSRALRDGTLTRFLQSTPEQLLNFILPQRLREKLFVTGVSSLGLNPVARNTGITILLAAVLSAVPFVPTASDYIIPIIDQPNINSDPRGNANNNNNGSNSNVNQPPNNNVLYVNKSISNDNSGLVISSFKADRTDIVEGEEVKLCWVLRNDQVDYNLTGLLGPTMAGATGPNEVKRGKGSNCVTVTPNSMGDGTTFVLEAHQQGDSDIRSISINIGPQKNCPPIAIINCPNSPVQSGTTLTLTGRVNTGRPPEEPYTYLWEVSPTGSKASESNSTSVLTLSLEKEGDDNQPFIVTLRVKGLEMPGCVNSDSCEINIIPKPVNTLADVQLKVTVERTKDASQSVRYNVRVETVRNDGTVVQGLRVWCVPNILEGTQGNTQSFTNLSSPTEMILNQGSYIFWATLDSDPTQKTKQIIVNVKEAPKI